MARSLVLLVSLLCSTAAMAQERPLVVNTTRLQALEPLPAPKVRHPSELYDAVLADLEHVPYNHRQDVRYLARWPATAEQLVEQESALLFWLASLNNRRTNPPLTVTEDGLLYRLQLSEYGWEPAAWEALIELDPYFRVTVIDQQYVLRRGWLDPVVEAAVREATHSRQAVCRADFFLARTSLEVNGTGFEKGVYSKFKRFPGTEDELFKAVGVDRQFLDKNFLVRGGAVLESIVALHNRELQLLPSLWGKDEAFVWRSLDAASSAGATNVLERFLGSINPDGREYIGTNLNGMHWYYLTNKDGKQVAAVPQNIAQDKASPHDVTVFSPWKCVSCHTPQHGIRHFGDVVSQLATHPKTGLAVITKYDKHQELKAADAQKAREMQRILEDYYLSDLGRTITRHQESYRAAVEEACGLQPTDAAKAYLDCVQRYLYARVSHAQAARELGIAEVEIDAYLKTVPNANLVILRAGQTVAREVFEGAYAAGMQSHVNSWERSLEAHVQPQPAAAAAVLPKVPAGAQLQPPHPQDAPGAVRFLHLGLLYLHNPDGRRWVYRNDGWDELD